LIEWSSFLQFATRYAFESRYSQFDSHDPILSDIKFTQGQELPTALQLKFCPANLLTHYGSAILERHCELYRIKVQRDVEARESLDLDIAYIIGAAHNTEQDWAKAHHRTAQ